MCALFIKEFYHHENVEQSSVRCRQRGDGCHAAGWLRRFRFQCCFFRSCLRGCLQRGRFRSRHNSTDIDLEVTDGEKLSNALAEAGVISQDEADAGFVTTVNGVTADYNADGAWWCLTDATGEMTTVGVADIELHDGDSYAFTYTK